MVKLFVGNLAESVDSLKLRQVFKPFTNITECDVVKNYAFITIPDEDQTTVMSRMDGYVIEGKQIQVKLSTSKLRSQGSVPVGSCLRCGNVAHKTPQCPDDPKNRVKETIVIDLTRGTKRVAEGNITTEAAKRPAVVDPEIPQPPEPELQSLYDEYRLARQRYDYYRDRLIKEIEAKRGVGTAFMVFNTPGASASGTQLSSGPISYQTDVGTLPAYKPPTVSGSHPYASSTPLKAPYAPAAATTTPSAVYTPPQDPNSMTSQQFLQQQMAQSQAPQPLISSTPQPLMATTLGPPPPVAPSYSSPSVSAAPYSSQTTTTIPWMQQQAMNSPLTGQTQTMGTGVKLTIQ